METYKGWKIEYADYGFFVATNLNDCDAYLPFAKSVEELKTEIDELNEEEE
jgi:hypothetical protein